MKFKRPCAEPRCPEITTEGRCERHARKARRQYDDRRGTTKERGYGGTWRKVRRMYMRRHPLCERCEASGRVIEAALVHHRDRDTSNNTDANLEALCRRCHEIEHAQERRWTA